MSELLTEMLKVGLLLIEVLVVVWLLGRNEKTIVRVLDFVTRSLFGGGQDGR